MELRLENMSDFENVTLGPAKTGLDPSGNSKTVSRSLMVSHSIAKACECRASVEDGAVLYLVRLSVRRTPPIDD